MSPNWVEVERIAENGDKERLKEREAKGEVRNVCAVEIIVSDGHRPRPGSYYGYSYQELVPDDDPRLKYAERLEP